MKNYFIRGLIVVLSLSFWACQDKDNAVCPFDPAAPPVWRLDTIAVAQEVAANGIWGNNSSDIYAVGMVDDGSGPSGTVWRYDGTSWAEFYSRPNAELRDIHGVSAQSLWIAGILDPSNYPGGALVLHWNGTNWQESLTDASIPGLLAIWASSDHDVYAVGRAGTIMHFEGTTWAQEEKPIEPPPDPNVWRDMEDVWGISHDQEQHVYIGAARRPVGVVLRKNGENAWDIDFQIPYRGSASFCVGVWARDANDVYALEETGRGTSPIGNVYHYGGSEWSRTDLYNETGVFRVIRGDSEGNIFVLGWAVYRLEGSTWNSYRDYPGHGTFALNDVWVNGRDIFVAGSRNDFGVVLNGRFGGSCGDNP